MTNAKHFAILCCLLTAGLTASGSNEKPLGALRLLLNEVQAGSMASEQYCTLIFDSHRFHTEKASRKLGQDRDRRVFEGEIPEADWKALDAIIDSTEFRKLNVPPSVTPLIVEDAHTITISVARDAKFQNMEFLDNKSRKPYESQLNPLLKWWKSFRSATKTPSNVPADSRCALDSTHAVFSQ